MTDDAEKRDERTQDRAEDTGAEQTQGGDAGKQNAVTKKEEASVGVEVPSEMLASAVSQIQRLSELRERELASQKEAIATMRSAVEQQRRSLRLGLLSMFLILAVAITGLGVTLLIRNQNEQMREGVDRLTGGVDAAAAAVEANAEETQAALAKVSEEQEERLSEVQTVVKTGQEEQGKIARKIGDDVAEAKTLVAKASADQAELKTTVAKELEGSKNELAKTRTEIVDKMEKSVAELRAERDRVQAEVKSLLEEKVGLLTDRELELERERVRVSEMEDDARERTRDVIANAMRRLSEFEGAPRVRLEEEEEAAEGDAEEDEEADEEPTAEEPGDLEQKEPESAEEPETPAPRSPEPA